MHECENCGVWFDPVGYRWRCYSCGWKTTCCDGAPLALRVVIGSVKEVEESSVLLSPDSPQESYPQAGELTVQLDGE